ncbi:MAG: phosphate acyltransferase PlsX [Chloroflexi bacterium]|nr:MAG: phosphate acyltransferase PlsX [Chloroflexota bacterium]
MKIVLDAMGGDHAPAVTVEGGVLAARSLGDTVILVGRQDVVNQELAKHDTTQLDLPVVHASEVIEMEEHPATAVRSKKDSSMVVGMELVRRGEADAFVSVGNTGGVLAAALLHLGRIKGVKRPALSTIFPTRTGHCFMLDIGANADVKPEYLYQFATMGAAYAELVLGFKNPRVGLVSIGEEPGKGNQLVQEAFDLLAHSTLNFIGNVEGKDIPRGLADVVVTDGFTGNVIIKLGEGVAGLLMEVLEEEIRRRPLAMAGALLAKGAFSAVKGRLDYRKYGGGALLGVDGVVIVGHGRSDATAVAKAIEVAHQAVERNIVEAIRQGISEAELHMARSDS